MTSMKILISTCLSLFVITFNLSAQEQLGLRTDNFSGVNSLALNPANFLSGSLKWDANIAGAALFGETNYGFLHNTHLAEIARLAPEVESVLDYDSENRFPANTLMADFYDTSRKKYFTGLATILGPSFSIKFESGHSLGIFTNLRAAASSQKIPASFNFYHWDRTPFYESIGTSPVQIAAMVWSEVGLNYGRRFLTNRGKLDLGVSVKILQGYEGFFFDNKTGVNVTQLPNDSFDIEGPHFAFGLTTSNTSGEDVTINKNGNGVAFDLGAVFTIDGDDDSYKWKIGFSILDIGKIKFNKNAAQHEIETYDNFTIVTDDYSGRDDVDDMIKLLSHTALGDSTASLTKNEFGIWLPGAISFQADYSVTPNVFVNGLLIQRFKYQSAAVERGNLLAITPRFESRWLGVSLPLSLYNWNEFNFGAALRLGFVTIGSENLGSYFKRSDFTGSDFYLAVKVNPFNLKSGKGSRGKNVKCYFF